MIVNKKKEKIDENDEENIDNIKNEFEINLKNNVEKTLKEKYENEYNIKIRELNSSLDKQIQEKKIILDKLKAKKKKEKEIRDRKIIDNGDIFNNFSIFNKENLDDDNDNDEKNNFYRDYRRKRTVPAKQFNKNDKNIRKIENMYYSFECDYSNNINLITYINVGTESAKIDLVLKNNGTLDWSDDTKLIFDKKSDILGNEVKLKPQKKNEKEKYEIILNDLRDLDEGEYKSYVKFCIDGSIIGETLILILKVKKKEDPEEE